MFYSRAVVVWADADSMRAQCGTCGWLVAGAGTSFACDVFYLVAGEAFVEVGCVAVEVEDGFGGHARVDEEGGEGEASGVAEVVSAGEGVVEGSYAGWEGVGVDGLGVLFGLDGASAGGERVL